MRNFNGINRIILISGSLKKDYFFNSVSFKVIEDFNVSSFTISSLSPRLSDENLGPGN